MGLTYGEALRLPRWQKIRLEVLRRDGWECVRCGAHEKPLEVHHGQYRGPMPWDTPVEYLQALCDECHRGAHPADDMSPERLAEWAGKIQIYTGIANNLAREAVRLAEKCRQVARNG